jgi:predicted DNA binding protein
MYRHALELHLKAIVLGDGGSFLETKPDEISVHKTHSLSWLAQFVVQIVTKLGWRREFRCAGIENLDDFNAMVESINSVDPGAYTYRCFVDPNVEFNAGEFCRKMDALLALLDSAADALAAEWDLRSGAVPELEPDDGGFWRTIH